MINIIIPAMASISSTGAAGASRCATTIAATGPGNVPHMAGTTPEIAAIRDMTGGMDREIRAVTTAAASDAATSATIEARATNAAIGGSQGRHDQTGRTGQHQPAVAVIKPAVRTGARQGRSNSPNPDHNRRLGRIEPPDRRARSLLAIHGKTLATGANPSTTTSPAKRVAAVRAAK